jgi:plasmid stability protein
MPSLLIRGIPEDVGKALAADAERHRRSREKHALFLIEQALESRAAETCGELIDRIWKDPPPEVDLKAIDAFLAQRGRRSNRPNRQ